MLFDLFWIAAETSDNFYSNLLSNMQMQVYVSESASDEEAKSLLDNIKKIEGVSSAQYVSRETARKELANLVGTDLLVGYDSLNPLPRSYVITFTSSHLQSGAIEAIEANLKSFPEISKIDYSREWLDKAESTRKIILKVGMVLGGLILFTTVVASANNIRLMARSRAVGFWQMRLLGAGRLFISMPFLLEGFFIACFSVLLGWAVIFYGKSLITFTQFELTLPKIKEILLFCLAAGVLGLLSGFLGIRKMLK